MTGSRYMTKAELDAITAEHSPMAALRAAVDAKTLTQWGDAAALLHDAQLAALAILGVRSMPAKDQLRWLVLARSRMARLLEPLNKPARAAVLTAVAQVLGTDDADVACIVRELDLDPFRGL